MSVVATTLCEIVQVELSLNIGRALRSSEPRYPLQVRPPRIASALRAFRYYRSR
jgi:hypothetical protein